MNTPRSLRLWFSACLLALAPVACAADPVIDVHIHYDRGDAERYSAREILRILDRNQVAHAVVTSVPTDTLRELQALAPGRIIPFLNLYRTPADKAGWPLDPDAAVRAEAALQAGFYRGIGELHLFAEHRRSPVFRKIVELARQHAVILMIHGDPAVIDAAYEYAPGIRVIWAHAGTYPFPEVIEEYLLRYPALYVDLSVRDERIAPLGKLSPEWEHLLLEHPDRFLIGVDTYSTARWARYDEVLAGIRHWLGQLPEEVGRQIGHGNAAALFASKPGHDKPTVP